MSTVRVDVLAIGTLAANRYWKEKAPVRDEFATTSLVRAGDRLIVVDPGWPEDVLESVLFYRAGVRPGQVTDIFLTHIDPAHVRGIGLFHDVPWLAGDEEIVYARAELGDDSHARAIIEHLRPAPEHIAANVDIFPTPGHSPGHTSLMINSPTETTFVAGDAVLTRDHLEHGDLGPSVYDREKAEESFGDLLEIGDVIVPGHDNVCWLQGHLGLPL